MANSSKSDFLGKLARLEKEGWISARLREIVANFYLSFKEALEKEGVPSDAVEPQFVTFLNILEEQRKKPFVFAPYHESVRKPFDYYRFGNDFFRPLIDFAHSTIKGRPHLDEIASRLKKGENVILLANHQTEGDPYAISLLIEKDYPALAEEMIFVAGMRVITDPVAIPFSMGRNLLCIYSKRYIDHPPEEKAQKQLHNKRTMQLMSDLLGQGGKIIYVAPSGGRDRPNAAGKVEVAPFDAQSIEMLYLMSKKASRPTHFYPLALATYALFPPPDDIQVELGEDRVTKLVDIHLAFGKQIDMENFPGSEEEDKHARRKARANYIWNLVKEDYEQIANH